MFRRGPAVKMIGIDEYFLGQKHLNFERLVS